MNVDLQDGSGDLIQATFFKDAVERFVEIIKENRIYLLSNGQIKPANRKFTNIDHDYSISFDKHAIVKDVSGPDIVDTEPRHEEKPEEPLLNLGQIFLKENTN